MKRRAYAKMILAILGSILVILLVMLGVLPFLNRIFVVKVASNDAAAINSIPVPDKPEAVPVTVFYIMEENSRKVSELYIEIFHSATGTVSYMEIPVDTKVDLSEELYKSLQTYGPELPQHFTLANMTESFSAEYGLTAGNRILSEVLGISLTEYVRSTSEIFQDWLEFQAEEKTETAFFENYSLWLKNTSSSRTMEERWTYYENRTRITNVVTETAPGSREKDGYRLASKRARERVEAIMLGTEQTSESKE